MNLLKKKWKKEELKKVSDGAIIEAAMQRGNIIADSAQKLLGSSLKKAIAEGGVQNAVKYCNLAAYPIMDSIDFNLILIGFKQLFFKFIGLILRISNF